MGLVGKFIESVRNAVHHAIIYLSIVQFNG